MPIKRECPVCGRKDFLVPYEVPAMGRLPAYTAFHCRKCAAPYVCEKTEYGFLFYKKGYRDEET